MTGVVPHEPPRVTQDEDPVARGIAAEPEDFVVDEIPLYPPTGEGEHWMVQLRKRGLTTTDAVAVVARAAGVAQRDIGYAGMKDRHAVTTQWLTLPAHGASLPERWELPSELTVLAAERHGSKIRTGHLAGNRFRIRLLEAGQNAAERARAIGAALVHRGLPNYFGGQRFGRAGENLARAIEWLDAGAPPQGKRTRFYRKLYPSVVQAEVFNRYLTERRQLGIETLLAGEVVRLARSKASFRVEEVSAEQPRFDARDIIPTGPLPGPKMKPAAGRPEEIESQVQAELGLTPALLATLGKWADGTRRDLLIWPEHWQVEPGPEGSFWIEFALPPGAYATQVLRELMSAQWLERGVVRGASEAPAQMAHETGFMGRSRAPSVASSDGVALVEQSREARDEGGALPRER